MSEKTYTIEQIKKYLEGCLLLKNDIDNRQLEYAIRNIDDYEDGIEAMILRDETTESNQT